jgi:molybdate transport system ATP-binding protein
VTLDAHVRVSRGGFVLDAALTAADGEMLAVVGPNGAGKTTLLHALAGLVPLDAGHVTLDGVALDDPAAGRFVPPHRRPVGVVFQDYLLFAHLDVRDNVAFGLRERGARKTAARERAVHHLGAVGMGKYTSVRPHALSGGQAQRVALARALATEPRLLLLDEPLAALDVQTRVETRRHLRATLSAFAGVRVLVTHDPVDAFALADRLCILEGGRVTQTGTPSAIANHPRSDYVAELVGVNLYRGRARGDDVAVGGAHLRVAGAHDGDVLVVVPPHAVVLHPAPPAGSARNTWVGTIAAIERLASRTRVRVHGVLDVVAEVTPAAVDALELREGREVWVAVKATEIMVYPA